MEKVHSAQCTDATTECKVLVPNVYNVVTNRAEKAGNTVLGYFYCTHVKTGKGMGGTFSIKCAANGTLTGCGSGILPLTGTCLWAFCCLFSCFLL